MPKVLRTRAGMMLALAAVLLAAAGRGEARNPFPKLPPVVQTPPPVVTTTPPPPVVTTTPPPGGTTVIPPPPPCPPPGGTTQHAPEPASLISGLIGLGVLGVAARRRKQAATA